MSGDESVDPPRAARVEQVTLSHGGGERLTLAVDFVGTVPPEPRVVQGRFGPMEAPGSIFTDFLIDPLHVPGDAVIAVSSPSPSVEQGWHVDVSEFDEKGPVTLVSVSADGDVLTLTLDLGDQDEILGAGEFRADVHVVQMVEGQPDSDGAPNPFPVKAPECRWDTTAVSAGTTANPTSRQTAPNHTPSPPSSGAPDGVPGTDAGGFVDYPGARCNEADEIMTAARTTQSVLVVCRGPAGHYYRGSRLADRASVTLDNVVAVSGGFDAQNPADGTRYEVRSTALTIRSGDQVYVEPTVHFWSAGTGPAPAAGTGSTDSPPQYFRTTSGLVRCRAAHVEVVCERTSAEGFPQAPQDESTGGRWNLAAVSEEGEFRWDQGNIGGADINGDIVLEYGRTYRYNGWTIAATSDGTRITNDSTDHGMFVSIERVQSF